MIGIILASHGTIAKGMFESAKMFFGNDIEQFTYVSLDSAQTADELEESLRQSIHEVNKGDGVIVLADLFGGTPCNRAIQCMEGDTHIISGVNFPILLELLGARQYNEVDMMTLVQTGQQGITYVNGLI